MSYLSHVTGCIEIRPPLRWSAVRDSKFLPVRAQNGDVDVRYEINETTEHTDNGVMVRRTAVAVVAAWEDKYKAYRLAEHLAEIGAEITAAGSGGYGYLVRSGDDQGDVERYGYGPGNKVVPEKATLHWEDGSEVES